jgi:hypothetical protein
MDDLFKDEYLNDYTETIDFLNYIYKSLHEKIKCKPVIKIIEDNVIVGILTNANQFVPVYPVEDTFEDDLIKQNDTNYYSADSNIINNKVDVDRVMYIKKINIENEFYNVFRNTIHNILSEFKNRKRREELERIIYSPTKLYIAKVREVDRFIHELTKGVFIFQDYTDEELLSINEVTSCYTTCVPEIYCVKNEDVNGNGKCSLRIPKTNLINSGNNEERYYGRISDEMIRYNRIRTFMFQPKSFIAFSDLGYKLRDNEIILLQSLITEDPSYFDNLVQDTPNPYVKHNTHYTAQPYITQPYNNTFEMDKRQYGEIYDCKVSEAPLYGRFKAVFKNGKELTYNNSSSACSFTIIIDMIKKFNPLKHITIADIKNILLDEYMKKYVNNIGGILHILHNEGKQIITNQIMMKQVSFEYMIMSEDYYLSNLDLLTLVNYFKIPVVFVSSAVLKENNKTTFSTHYDMSDMDNLVYIKPPVYTKNINTNYDLIPPYKWIVSSSELEELIVDEKVKKEIRENTMTLQDYIIKEDKSMKMKTPTVSTTVRPSTGMTLSTAMKPSTGMIMKPSTGMKLSTIMNPSTVSSISIPNTIVESSSSSSSSASQPTNIQTPSKKLIRVPNKTSASE